MILQHCQKEFQVSNSNPRCYEFYARACHRRGLISNSAQMPEYKMLNVNHSAYIICQHRAT